MRCLDYCRSGPVSFHIMILILVRPIKLYITSISGMIHLSRKKPRPIPPMMFEEVRDHLKEMETLGVIRRSQSPYASNVVIVRKKNGPLRFCLDLCHLNQLTVPDCYSLPGTDLTPDILSGSRWFSCLDLKSGYWQVPLAEKDKCKTTFTVGPLGFWECERMPFGLTNAPATFQRLM